MNDTYENCYLSLIELLMVILIIGLLSSICLSFYQNYMEQAKNTELILLGSDLRVRTTLNYAVNGEWEEPFKDNNGDQHGNTGAFYWKNNATIVVEKSTNRLNNHEQLSFQGFITKDKQGVDTGIALWLCGYKTHFLINPEKIKHQTTIPPEQLPFACR